MNVANFSAFTLVIFFTIFIPQLSWCDADSDFLSRVDEEAAKSGDAYITSFRSFLKWRDQSQGLKGQWVRLDIPNDSFHSGKAPALLTIRHSRGEMQKKPLMIFLAGLGADVEGYQMRSPLMEFALRDYHVLALTNSASLDYMLQDPKFQFGDLESEARAQLQMVNSVRSVLKDSITEVHFLGQSYGALVLAVMASDPSFPMAKSIYLLSPPAHLGKSMLEVDRLITRNYQRYDQELKSLNFPVLLWRVLTGEVQSHKQLDWVEALVVGSFRRTLWVLRSYMEGHRNLQRHRLPSSELLNFSQKEFVEKYWKFKEHPFRDHRGYFSLRDRVRKARLLGQPMKIFASKDDFINSDRAWDRWVDPKDRSSLLVFPHGGHLGFMSFQVFEEWINARFGKPQRRLPHSGWLGRPSAPTPPIFDLRQFLSLPPGIRDRLEE